VADADLKRKDEHQRTLLHELDHRVKNTLAIIQSLVTQSVRGSASPEHFREAIIGRVMALARSHEVLSAANWNDPEVGNVAGAMLAREAERIHYDGDRVSLAPRVVVAFAQIFHELLANAEKHGSLSRPEGRVTVTWRLEGTNLHLLWVETSSEPPAVAALKGLGTTIVRICIERQLGGTCHFEAAPDGLRFEATVPLRSELGLNATAMEQTPARKSGGDRTLVAAPTSASQTGAQSFIASD
jgi:two-component sensor histidine kinase